MRLLLDTHVFLWWVGNADELSAKAREVIGNPDNDCMLSTASSWEMAIKSSIGKLKLRQPVDRFIPEQLAANGFRQIDIRFCHVSALEILPFHHRDPFDRLLSVQARQENLLLVSADPIFDLYGVTRIW
ncbi:MAG: type II toxin-antitoxin system VapC family toxin [Burkholderiales bacterium]